MAAKNSISERFGGSGRLVILAILFVAAAGYYRWRISSSGDAMQKVAQDLGLQLSNQGQRWRMRGNIDDMRVMVKITPENLGGDTRWFTDFQIDARDQPPGQIMGASLRQKVIDSASGSNWLATGDATFDKKVLISGDAADLLARLDASARLAVIDATTAGWALKDRSWSARESGPINSAQKLRSIIETGLAAARSLPLDGELSQALRRQAENDPVPEVRKTVSAVLGQRERITDENVVDVVLAEVDSPRSLEAALRLAKLGNQLEEVKIRLGSALYARDRTAEVIDALGNVGGLVEIAALNSVEGEHEALARKAIAKIKKRLELKKQNKQPR